jgi:RNA polymerase primary sigma factor
MTDSLRREVQRALSTLTQRESDVITLYFGLNGEHAMTLEEIGEKFNLTRERVRQIKEKAIRRLRHTSRSKALKALPRLKMLEFNLIMGSQVIETLFIT